MASYTIPEEIVGLPLFVPDAYDFFEIEAAGMPNGDDCLLIHGDVNSNYKAFMPAPAVSPDLFRLRNPGGSTEEWAMSVWLKLPLLGGTTGTYQNVLFGVMNSLMDDQSGDFIWYVGTHLSGATRSVYFVENSSGGANKSYPDANWHLYVVNHNGISSFEMFQDLDAVSSSSNIAAGAFSNLFFCIGAYSDAGTVDGYDQEWRMGKLAFHDHRLNQTERAMLYNAMMT